MAALLVVDRGRRERALAAEVVDDPRRLAPLQSPTAWRILRALAEGPAYAGALARRLRLQEQAVYYHVNRLLAAGLLRVVREEPRRGATSRVVAPAAAAFALVVGPGGVELPRPAVDPPLLALLGDLVAGGRLDATLVVGAPQPHGPFLTAARDGHLAAEVALLLGRLGAPRGPSAVQLDTEVRAGAAAPGNLIVIGGPVTNLVAMDLNPHLPVRFNWREAWRLVSGPTGRSYGGEAVGLVAKVPNPWRPGGRVLLLSGLHLPGTAAAVIALTRHPAKLVAGQRPGAPLHRVVEGLDRDGDGRIDDVEVLE